MMLVSRYNSKQHGSYDTQGIRSNSDLITFYFGGNRPFTSYGASHYIVDAINKPLDKFIES